LEEMFPECPYRFIQKCKAYMDTIGYEYEHRQIVVKSYINKIVQQQEICTYGLPTVALFESCCRWFSWSWWSFIGQLLGWIPWTDTILFCIAMDGRPWKSVKPKKHLCVWKSLIKHVSCFLRTIPTVRVPHLWFRMILVQRFFLKPLALLSMHHKWSHPKACKVHN